MNFKEEDVPFVFSEEGATKRLNEQVKRNKERFPDDFMFQLNNQDVINLRSQIASSSWGGRRALPYAFIEHGAVMAADMLNSIIVIDASILLVRTFIKMRSMLSEHADLKKRLHEIESRLARGFAQHQQELQEIRSTLVIWDFTIPCSLFP